MSGTAKKGHLLKALTRPTMKKILRQLPAFLDDLKIRTKFHFLYILCILLPLVATDTFIITSIIQQEQETRRYDMERYAVTATNMLANDVDAATTLGETLYRSLYINEFLLNDYENSSEYFNQYQQFLQDTLFSRGQGFKNLLFTN